MGKQQESKDGFFTRWAIVENDLAFRVLLPGDGVIRLAIGWLDGTALLLGPSHQIGMASPRKPKSADC